MPASFLGKHSVYIFIRIKHVDISFYDSNHFWGHESDWKDERKMWKVSWRGEKSQPMNATQEFPFLCSAFTRMKIDFHRSSSMLLNGNFSSFVSNCRGGGWAGSVVGIDSTAQIFHFHCCGELFVCSGDFSMTGALNGRLHVLSQFAGLLGARFGGHAPTRSVDHK